VVYYSKHGQRLEKLEKLVKDAAGMGRMTLDAEKLKNPGDNMDYIYTLLVDKRIAINLTTTEEDYLQLENLTVEEASGK
jgi:hypothetical protein